MKKTLRAALVFILILLFVAPSVLADRTTPLTTVDVKIDGVDVPVKVYAGTEHADYGSSGSHNMFRVFYDESNPNDNSMNTYYPQSILSFVGNDGVEYRGFCVDLVKSIDWGSAEYREIPSQSHAAYHSNIDKIRWIVNELYEMEKTDGFNTANVIIAQAAIWKLTGQWGDNEFYGYRLQDTDGKYVDSIPYHALTETEKALYETFVSNPGLSADSAFEYLDEFSVKVEKALSTFASVLQEDGSYLVGPFKVVANLPDSATDKTLEVDNSAITFADSTGQAITLAESIDGIFGGDDFYVKVPADEADAGFKISASFYAEREFKDVYLIGTPVEGDLTPGKGSSQTLMGTYAMKAKKTQTAATSVNLFSISVLKTDDADEPAPLSGAEFELYYAVEGVASPDTHVKGSPVFDASGNIRKATTANDGTLTFGGLLPNNYMLVESGAPSGYYISGDGETLVTLIAKDVNVTVANCPIEDVDIAFKKVDNDGVFLPGATFTLTNKDDETDVRTAESAQEDGFVKFADVPAGTYTLSETSQPTGFEEYKTVYTIVVDETGWRIVYDGDADSTFYNDVADPDSTLKNYVFTNTPTTTTEPSTEKPTTEKEEITTTEPTTTEPITTRSTGVHIPDPPRPETGTLVQISDTEYNVVDENEIPFEKYVYDEELEEWVAEEIPLVDMTTEAEEAVDGDLPKTGGGVAPWVWILTLIVLPLGAALVLNLPAVKKRMK